MRIQLFCQRLAWRGAAALITSLITTLVAAQAPPGAPRAEASNPAPAAPTTAAGQRIVEATRAQLLQVRTLLQGQDSQASVGSGFVVDGTGLAVTNYHVISQFALRPERHRLVFRMHQGQSGTLELLAFDLINDLAVVRLVASPAPAAPWPVLELRPAAETLAKGERIYSLGNPLDVGFALSEGVYNGFVERSYVPQLFFGGALSGGMSGGPAVDERGRVIGVNVARRLDGEQVSFLVPADPVRALLERARTAKPLTTPQYEEVTRQLQAHQQGLVRRFAALPWREVQHAGWRVPQPQEEFMRCWGSTSPESAKPLKSETGQCEMNGGVYVSSNFWRAGIISVSHQTFDGTELGAQRLLRRLEGRAALGGPRIVRMLTRGSGADTTASQCRQRFIDRDGQQLRAAVCLAAYKRLEGLYVLSVEVVSVNHPTLAVRGSLQAFAVDMAGAMQLAEHYLNGFRRAAVAPGSQQ